MADRHLTSATPSAPEVAAANRAKLVAYTPEVIVDGLGPLNPALAITRYPDLATWMGRYQLVKQSGSIAIYELRTRTLP
jgi:hypothetical protein